MILRDRLFRVKTSCQKINESRLKMIIDQGAGGNRKARSLRIGPVMPPRIGAVGQRARPLSA